ncbi:toll/interleukin-1 receptor domain-containing protein [Cellvibrio sp. pealriver]|uniref:toll/interleukin-1 receptor domain-containing protein n=1 Tax=Cellvibrio sp. pealriver TaxID=1622269 RepID=UPI00066FDD55|nr:toll/interleukin-1 receptor domain-containing protein [Cellvibrio sp. pealriver]
MTDLRKNAIAFLQKRFPSAPVLNNEITFFSTDGSESFKIWPMIAQDPLSGMKQRAIAIEQLGSKDEIYDIALHMDKLFSDLDSSVYVKMGNSLKPAGNEIDTNQMIFSPRVILYTNKIITSMENVFQTFNSVNTLIDLIDESKIYKTLFVSYGGTDEISAIKINKKIKAKGIKTWFFPDDANPGDKLHRMMHDGVNNHDRVLLICSRESLNRPGVLNEIERILEREAREGGSEILIPVTLDDYVYTEWAPNRSDIANQIRSRVIIKLETESDQFDNSIEKLVKILTQNG